MDSSDILKSARHYTNHNTPVFVFEHGTVVITCPDAETAKKALKQVYDIPWNGEGSPYGDMALLQMDDGNLMVKFNAPFVFAVVSLEDYQKEIPLEKSATESFMQVEDKEKEIPLEKFAGLPRRGVHNEIVKAQKDLAHCLRARSNRSKDARELKIVARYVPTNWGGMKKLEDMTRDEVEAFVKTFTVESEYELLLETASVYSEHLPKEMYEQLLEVLMFIYGHALCIGILSVHDLFLHNKLLDFVKCNTPPELVEVVRSFKEQKKMKQH